MNVVFAISVVSTLLICQADITLSQCDQADWSVSLDRATWSTCPNSMTYLRGMWRNVREPGDERVGRIEYGRCCRATEPTYVHKPSTCSNANWLYTLDRWVPPWTDLEWIGKAMLTETLLSLTGAILCDFFWTWHSLDLILKGRRKQ